MDRVISAYEFAVEVAARLLGRGKDFKVDPSKINTRNVWPWSALVPLMEEDLLARVRLVPLYPTLPDYQGFNCTSRAVSPFISRQSCRCLTLHPSRLSLVPYACSFRGSCVMSIYIAAVPQVEAASLKT